MGGNGSRPPGGAGLELGWLHVHVSAVSRGVPGGAGRERGDDDGGVCRRGGGAGAAQGGPAPADAGAWILALYLDAAGTIGGAPPKTMAVPADRQEPVVLEHESGARIEIPPGATAGALGEDGAETVTVTIQEVEPPAGMGE